MPSVWSDEIRARWRQIGNAALAEVKRESKSMTTPDYLVERVEHPTIEDGIKRLIEIVRNEALEDAAKVADDAATNASGPVERGTAKYIAAQIRAKITD
jgi:hypothetical protein